MFQIILSFIAFFGGIPLYLINLLTFEQRMPRIYRILAFICSLIPVVGLLTFSVLYLYNLFSYQTNRFYISDDSKSVVRDTKLNRFLFNDIDWAGYEKHKNINKKPIEENFEEDFEEK